MKPMRMKISKRNGEDLRGVLLSLLMSNNEEATEVDDLG